MSLRRRLLVIPPIVVGVVVVIILANSRKAPRQVEAEELSTPVRVIRAHRGEVVPRSLGYGVAEPARVWQAVAQVAGRIVEKHPRAEAGASAERGTVLLRIDPRSYELAVTQTEAELARISAELAELSQREENVRRSLEIEKRSLAAAQREWQRKKDLVERAVTSQSEADQAETSYLQQLVRVREHENSLDLLPVERLTKEASLQQSQARLDNARLDLTFTSIEAPFPCRLVGVDFEVSQYVGVGQVLLEAHGVEVAEIVAQVPLNKMRHLISNIPSGPELLRQGLTGDVIDQLGLKASVRMFAGDFTAEWNARVDRISGSIDPQTRTLGVVVAVDKPYEQMIPGVRPPLVKDMYCETEIRGNPRPDRVVIPRSAFHEGHVYLVEADRLVRRPVEVAFALHDYLCLKEGLEEGELVIVSDPIPAINGMLVKSLPDEDLEQRIAAVARGEAPIR